MSGTRALALLVLCALPALFWRLGAPPIDRSMEGREALVVQEIVRSGDWILPRRNGDDVPHKPPLMHWVGAAIATARGGVVDETTTRLPSALASLASVVLLFLLVAPERGPAAGLLTALLLLTTESFGRIAREGWVDPVLAAGVLAAFVVFRRLERRAAWRGRAALGLAATVGATVLAKGPIGAVIPALGIGLYLPLTGQSARLRDLARPAAIAVGAAVALPWYVAAAVEGGALFVHTHVVAENLGRFVKGPEGSRPPWYFLKVIVPELAPWSLALPFAVVAAFRRRREPTLETLALAWLVGPFVFFSLSAGKRPAYLLPLVPAAAILVSDWARRLAGWRPTSPAFARRAAVVTALVTASALVWTAGAAAGWWRGASLLAVLGGSVRRQTFQPLADATATWPVLALASLLGIALAAGAAVLAAALGLPRRVLHAVVALHVVYVSFLGPRRLEGYKRARSPARFAHAAREIIGARPVYWLGTHEVSHIFFYLDRHVPQAPCARDAARLAACPAGFYIVDPALWARLDARRRGGAHVVLETRVHKRVPGGTNYLLVERPAGGSADDLVEGVLDDADRAGAQ